MTHGWMPAPAAHWSFDEGSGTTAADSAGGHPATLNGAAGWAAGESGGHSLDLDAGGNASVPTPVVDTSGDFTVAAWVRPDTLGGFQTAVSIDGTAVSGFYLQIRDDTGTFAFTRLPADSTAANSSAAVAGATLAPVQGAWHHLTGVNDTAAGVVRLYVDGVLHGETPYHGGWRAAGATAIGRGLYGGAQVDQFHGLIDEVYVFSAALDGDQVAALAGVPVGDTRPLLTVDAAHPGPAVSPELGGIMFEDINHSGEGGLYAELVNNRSFMASATTPLHWSAVGSGAIALDPGRPLNSALTRSLRLTVSASGDGIANEGFWGIPVRPATTYRASFFAASADAAGPVTVSIESADGGTVHAHGTVPALTPGWRKHTLLLRTRPSCPVAGDARLVLRTAATHGTIWFSQVSLFPPTYKNRENGLRVDIMEKLAALRPRFIRLPGGNYLEGNTPATRFDWKNTIGPVERRPGHMDDAWGYWSTDGLGLLEYLQWAEDLDAKPVLAVYAGYSLKGEVVTGAAFDALVQDALDEIEYVTGPVTSVWGARRAADGHPRPFPLEYVEIGNEDWFDRTGSYEQRFAAFHDAIKARHPDLKLIATTPVSSRPYDVIDEHFYPSASSFQNGSHKYDNRSRSGPKVFVGEWASQEGTPTPDFNAALGDASWLTGLIRNSDLVVMESYAPLLVNVHNAVWKTNLIGFDNLTSYGSPSYHAQVMLTNLIGDTIIPTSVRALPGLNVVTTRDRRTGRLYLVVVNTGAVARTTPVRLTGVRAVRPDGRVTQLTAASPADTNTLADPHRIEPRTSRVTGLAASFTGTFPAHSISVLQISAG